jgi:hypothetical protein
VAELRTHHQAELGHHVLQGQSWLDASVEGENTAALSYGALELRFAAERLAIHYWRALLGRRPVDAELRDIDSFKRIEKRIYELAGHQREIDGHFEFMRVILSALKIDMPLHTPHVGKLSGFWHDCSELCHIGWPLGCGTSEARQSAYARLSEISRELSIWVSSLGWPVLKEEKFAELRTRFVNGNATSEDVLAHVRTVGVWARVEFPDGRPSQFVGDAVPPQGQVEIGR